MLLDRPYALNDETFARTIADTDVPVLVDFYADWCGPCKMMAPYVDELAREKQGVALIAKLDTDRAQRTASGFNIRGIPTTIVFKNGKEAARQTGAVPKKALEDLLAKALIRPENRTAERTRVGRSVISTTAPTRAPAAAPSFPGSPGSEPRPDTAT